MRLARRALGGAADRAIERALGVDTAGIVQLEELGIAGENRVEHSPSDWLPLFRALHRLAVSRDDVFLDYGSGKGRALVAASLFPFRRVIGVELSSQLAAMSRHNLSRMRFARCRDTEVVEADAARFDVPDEVTVIFLFCPFVGPLFAAAMERVEASLRRRPRRVSMVYSNPEEHERVLARGVFRPLWAAPAAWPAHRHGWDHRLIVYAAAPAG